MTDLSSTSRWLQQLHQVLLRIRLPARDIVLADQVLLVDFAFLESQTLTAEVRRRTRETACFARTRRFAIGYRRPGELHPIERQGLERFAKALVRIEDRIPADFEGVGGFFVTSPTARQRFLRLFPFCTVEGSSAGTERIVEVMVRATSRCNQKCPFCTAPEHGTPSPTVMMALLRALPEAFPGAMVSLSGGEPTLRPSFLDEVALALSLAGIGQVQVQTNAVRFAEKIDPAMLAPDDRLSFFVSLHALEEGIYDRCTGTQGQLPLAVSGLQRLIRAGHRVTINCVVSSENFDHLVDYVRQLPQLVRDGSKVDLHFSTLICPESKPGAEAFLVPYPSVASRLRGVVGEAERTGIRVQSLRASTHASMPACMLEADERNRDPHRADILPHETGLLEEGRAWVKPVTCVECVEFRHCLGVPRPYALRFGLGDLRPLREE